MTSKLLLDTNILIDYMIESRPQHDSAHALFSRLGHGMDEGYVSAGALKDVYYITRKAFDDETARWYLRRFALVLTILPIGLRESLRALNSDESDYEDGLVRAVAELNAIDFIITRDDAAFERSTIRSMTAQHYLEIFS